MGMTQRFSVVHCVSTTLSSPTMLCVINATATAQRRARGTPLLRLIGSAVRIMSRHHARICHLGVGVDSMQCLRKSGDFSCNLPLINRLAIAVESRMCRSKPPDTRTGTAKSRWRCKSGRRVLFKKYHMLCKRLALLLRHDSNRLPSKTSRPDVTIA
ncbi:hypothetical protein EJ02DRAFT_235361 [Clathrospora elynae]|uniref:Uncharacterized protein n=1 Tax=Clathrospora elynae TaxID=706981 RepID=A0A6A5T1K5_9PLEO|nr:hypothetical protein EJ02DRAFT_235361 [Clathrospora elynae]